MFELTFCVNKVKRDFLGFTMDFFYGAKKKNICKEKEISQGIEEKEKVFLR
jgi:hypothetical protein